MLCFTRNGVLILYLDGGKWCGLMAGKLGRDCWQRGHGVDLTMNALPIHLLVYVNDDLFGGAMANQ